MDILNSKLKYAVIGGLVIILFILYLAVQRLTSRQPDQEEVSPTPAEVFPPTITPVDVRSTIPTMSAENKKELQYPVKFEEITVVYKSQSGTFLIYHLGDPAIAKASFTRLMQQMSINPALYLVEYRSLEPDPLPPRGFPQDE
jgi:hypothetical protein